MDPTCPHSPLLTLTFHRKCSLRKDPCSHQPFLGKEWFNSLYLFSVVWDMLVVME